MRLGISVLISLLLISTAAVSLAKPLLQGRVGVTELGEPALIHPARPPFKLNVLAMGQVIIATGSHRLGDNSLDDWSHNSGDLRQAKANSPLWRQGFTCPDTLCATQPLQLVIEPVSGIDTLTAHTAQRSQNPYHASPVEVRIDNVLVGQLHQNGSRITVPVGVLKAGNHQLSLTAGWHIDSAGRKDWDDMAFGTITLQPVGN